MCNGKTFTKMQNRWWFHCFFCEYLFKQLSSNREKRMNRKEVKKKVHFVGFVQRNQQKHQFNQRSTKNGNLKHINSFYLCVEIHLIRWMLRKDSLTSKLCVIHRISPSPCIWISDITKQQAHNFIASFFYCQTKKKRMMKFYLLVMKRSKVKKNRENKFLGDWHKLTYKQYNWW